MGDVGEAAKAFLELLKIIKEIIPDEAEKFEKEWRKDEQIFTKAWKNRDADTLNMLFDKYWALLQKA